MPVRCFNCRRTFDNYLDHEVNDNCGAGAYSVPSSKQSVRDAAEIYADAYGIPDAIDAVQARLRNADGHGEVRACLEALSWLRRRRDEASPDLVADGGEPIDRPTGITTVPHYSWQQVYRACHVPGWSD